MRNFRFIFFIIITIILFSVHKNAESSATGKKCILGLYKSSENCTAVNNPIFNFLRDPLKKLGYSVDYIDALGKLPEKKKMEKYEAVLTFFFGPVHPKSGEYLKWLKEQIENGRKVIILGNLGAHTPDGAKWLPFEQINDFLIPFGLIIKGSQTVNPDDIVIKYQDKSIVESIPSPMPGYYMKLDSIFKENKDYLRLSLKDQSNSDSIPVIRTPYGAMAQLLYLYKILPKGQGLKWHINRQAFLRDVLSYKTPEEPLVKRLLGLYKSSDKHTDENNLIRKFAAKALLNLGYIVDYYDIDKGLPNVSFMEGYYGIVTWYLSPLMKNAGKYCNWLAENLSNKKKIIILGNFGAYAEPVESGETTTTRFLDDYELNNFFYPFGLRMDKTWTSNQNLIKCDYIDPEVMNVSLLSKPQDFKNYFAFISVNPKNKPYLTLSRKDVNGSSSFVVASTPYGGNALETYIYVQDTKTWETKYKIDLEKFFSDCLRKVEFIPPETFTIKVDENKEEANHLPNRFEFVPKPCNNPIPRKIMILYKGSEVKNFQESPFYQYTGPIINYLGLTSVYIDIEKTKPDDEMMKDYVGVITWFFGPTMPGVNEYNKWLLHQIENGKKIIMLGHYGALNERGTYKFAIDVENVFNHLGLSFPEEHFYIKKSLKSLNNELITLRPLASYGVFSFGFELGRSSRDEAFYIPSGISLKNYEKKYFNFESPLKISASTNAMPLKSLSKSNRTLLSLNTFGEGEISPAIIGLWGGCLFGNFFYEPNPEQIVPDARNYKELLDQCKLTKLTTDKKNNGKWIINPFLFFSEALGISELPKPDYTTINGQRILYSHIDGDGLNNLSQTDPLKHAGEIIRDEIFKKYNIPITASVISNEMTEDSEKYFNYPLMLGRSIFNLDNIEVGTHSHTHPFDMALGDLIIDFNKATNEKIYKKKFVETSPERETLYSTALINQNMIKDEKRTKIILWPGKCNPTEELIAWSDKLGLDNINGGNPIFDKGHDSYSNLCPVMTLFNDKIQVHTSNCNDYIYTSAWTGDLGGFKNVIETIENTGKPIRISPIDIYYHYYSGGYKESLDALKIVYDYALKLPIAPIFTSQYSSIIKDFYFSQMGKTDDSQGYIFRNLGYIRTLRFDNNSLSPDLDRSNNIIGFNYFGNSLYIFLDESLEHIVYLTEKQQTKPYLKSASHYIEKWYATPGSIKANISGLGKGQMEIMNLRQQSVFNIKIGDTVFTSQSDEKGLLAFKYVLSGFPKDYTLEINTQ